MVAACVNYLEEGKAVVVDGSFAFQSSLLGVKVKHKTVKY